MKLALLLFIPVFSAAAEISVVVHPSNQANIDAASIEKIFTGKLKAFDDGAKATPVRLLESHAASEEFNTKVLNKSSSQLKAYWSKLVFTGKGTPPKEFDSEEELLKQVASNPDFIGFVSSAKVTADVKVIQTF
ncbi:phosphate ABC transporter substrate-binding protein [Pseudoalteromonas fenneropenaei]|uniref:Phosphate ABC transporter substrate-binding protein n=1 Tax=Pseudoalteromonas fenneropenaei TaxID=1737459 RepID=A0ABV7CG15_9GAMM